MNEPLSKAYYLKGQLRGNLDIGRGCGKDFDGLGGAGKDQQDTTTAKDGYDNACI